MSAKKSAAAAAKDETRRRLSQADVPSMPLEQAMRVPKAIGDDYAFQPTRPLSVAQAMGMQPSSGPFRMLCGAAIAYGLTDGGYNVERISVTPLARRILAPTEDGDDLKAKREAFLRPRLIGTFLRKYDGNKFPRDDIAANVLLELGVPKEATTRTLTLIRESADALGFLKDINGTKYVDLEGTPHSAPSASDCGGNEQEEASDPEREARKPPLSNVPRLTAAPSQPPLSLSTQPSQPRNAIFIGHGKNRTPLAQLEKLLAEYKVPYRVAVDEANQGRPISQKVADVMNECGAAIIIFTADEEFTTADDSKVVRPSENAIYELGAAGVLFGNRIIILKEASVSFPTNFRDIGHISFEKDQLTARAIEIFRELINFGLLKISVA